MKKKSDKLKELLKLIDNLEKLIIKMISLIGWIAILVWNIANLIDLIKSLF